MSKEFNGFSFLALLLFTISTAITTIGVLTTGLDLYIGRIPDVPFWVGQGLTGLFLLLDMILWFAYRLSIR